MFTLSDEFKDFLSDVFDEYGDDVDSPSNEEILDLFDKLEELEEFDEVFELDTIPEYDDYNEKLDTIKAFKRLYEVGDSVKEYFLSIQDLLIDVYNTVLDIIDGLPRIVFGSGDYNYLVKKDRFGYDMYLMVKKKARYSFSFILASFDKIEKNPNLNIYLFMEYVNRETQLNKKHHIVNILKLWFNARDLDFDDDVTVYYLPESRSTNDDVFVISWTYIDEVRPTDSKGVFVDKPITSTHLVHGKRMPLIKSYFDFI